MAEYFADFHVHVGISEGGRWIKIPTSRQLTLRNILFEAAERKGMQLLGIVDALSPLVREDLELLEREGLLRLDSQGGYRFQDQLTLILGAEIETTEDNGGRAHTLIFLPDAEQMASFARIMAKHIRNINLSSQNAHMSLARLIQTAAEFDSLIVPAHVFTPYKGLYGSCTARMANILSEGEMAAIAAVELGLSADSALADQIGELAGYTFVTNSDAHSLEKIAREYNLLKLTAPTFAECALAFARQGGRSVAGNYGLDPRLGKYHRTFCPACDYTAPEDASFTEICPVCGSRKIVRGVFDRINAIADFPSARPPEHRPLYHYQIPLSFIPGVGKRALARLLDGCGTEMNILHHTDIGVLNDLVGEKTAAMIGQARSGTADIKAGGGGVYGKLAKN